MSGKLLGALRIAHGHLKQSAKIAFGPSCLLLTNIGVSAFLSGTGDCVQQRIASKQPFWDAKRTTRMAIAGSSMGLVCHYWYIWLDRFLPGRGIRTVVKKVLWDQLLLSPVMWAGYFVVLEMLEEKKKENFIERVKHVGSKVYIAEWLVWPPAQVFNFYYLPTRFRVLYDNIISLGFDVYSSYLIHDAKWYFSETEERKSYDKAISL